MTPASGLPSSSATSTTAPAAKSAPLGFLIPRREKLAKLLLEWSTKNGEATKTEPRLKLALTHEEIAQMIGTSRETVTRLFADLKRRQIVQTKGSTLLIRNKSALRAMAIVP